MNWIYLFIYLFGVGFTIQLEDDMGAFDGNPILALGWPLIFPIALLFLALWICVLPGTYLARVVSNISKRILK